MKQWLKNKIPSRDTLLQHKTLAHYRHWLHHPHLFYFNNKSISRAFAVGLFWAWIPMPFQMIPAALSALKFKANLPLSVALVWITNPITMPPLFLFAYQVGRWILGPSSHVSSTQTSWSWLSHSLYHIWPPFLLGCLLMGVLSSVIGYMLTKWLWKRSVLKTWRVRQNARLQRVKAVLSKKPIN